jgi:hypothetical protein
MGCTLGGQRIARLAAARHQLEVCANRTWTPIFWFASVGGVRIFSTYAILCTVPKRDFPLIKQLIGRWHG